MPKLDFAFLRRVHVVTDCALVSVSWLGAYWVRYALSGPLRYPINPFDTYLAALPLIVLPWIFTCWMFGIYRTARMKTLVDELQILFRGVALGLLVVSAIGFFFREFHFGRFVVVASAGFSLLLQGGSRIFFHRVERRMRLSGDHDVPP